MGIIEFNLIVDRTIEAHQRNPESWAGEDANPFWDHGRRQAA